MHAWSLVWGFNCRTFYISSLEVKLSIAPLGMPKLIWPSMSRYRKFFVQMSSPTPRKVLYEKQPTPEKTPVKLKGHSPLSTITKLCCHYILFSQHDTRKPKVVTYLMYFAFRIILLNNRQGLLSKYFESFANTFYIVIISILYTSVE